MATFKAYNYYKKKKSYRKNNTIEEIYPIADREVPDNLFIQYEQTKGVLDEQRVSNSNEQRG